MTERQKMFIKTRREIIRREFSDMNERQFEAITTTEGPLLVLAGAGSGKTTVLINRIANLIRYGQAYNSDEVPGDDEIGELLERGADSSEDMDLSVNAPRPWQILAITFTNKAAGELKDRIAAKLGDSAAGVTAGTFHSLCARILRVNADRAGYSGNFTIYDTDDQKRLIKSVYAQTGADEKFISPKYALNAFSRAKERLLGPGECDELFGDDYRGRKTAELYAAYQSALREANAMDFNDLIMQTVLLLRGNEEVREKYRRRFRYVMVDEYQDTDRAQFALVSLLAGGTNNLCVVGDDDQSIYKFRGATIENILNFEKTFANARVIRLEQNYRSTQNILDAANGVIRHNESRKGKVLWTENGRGSKVLLHTASDEQDEARFVAETILRDVKQGGKFRDHAVLYRMNAQSQTPENVFARSGIPYRVIGGQKFFERKEIKDILAYLCVIENPGDSLRLRRIINEPKRGIGDTTVKSAAEIADLLGDTLYSVIEGAENFPVIRKSAAKLEKFLSLIRYLRGKSAEVSLTELIDEILSASGYRDMLLQQGEEGLDRLRNVEELKTNVSLYESQNEDASLAGFLEEIALITDIDSYDASDDAVTLMTVHSAKGLEFDTVFLTGMEEGIFPGNSAIYGDGEEIEEERRLAYVGITRAKRRLILTNARQRMLFGKTGANSPSRFMLEIPAELCETDAPPRNPVFIPAARPRRTAGFAGPVPAAEFRVYGAGERVHHRTFGSGTVISANPVGNDYLLEISFDNTGTKKIMAKYAKLEPESK